MRKGFTLIELIAIIMILGILTVIALPNISKIIKESKTKKLYYSINTIVDSVGNINIEGTNDCWYRSSNDNYKLPSEISDLEIFIFRKNGKYKYGVYATYNDTDIMNTTDFKSLNAKDRKNWIDNDNLLDPYLGIGTNDISKIFEMDFCKVLEEK